VFTLRTRSYAGFFPLACRFYEAEQLEDYWTRVSLAIGRSRLIRNRLPAGSICDNPGMSHKGSYAEGIAAMKKIAATPTKKRMKLPRFLSFVSIAGRTTGWSPTSCAMNEWILPKSRIASMKQSLTNRSREPRPLRGRCASGPVKGSPIPGSGTRLGRRRPWLRVCLLNRSIRMPAGITRATVHLSVPWSRILSKVDSRTVAHRMREARRPKGLCVA